MRKRLSIIALAGIAVISSAILIFSLVPMARAIEKNISMNKTGRNPAGVLQKASSTSPAARLGPDKALPKSQRGAVSGETFPLILRGTVNWDTPYARAVIEDAVDKKQRLYKVGDMVKNGIIIKISRERVVIKFNSEDIILSMKSGPRPAENATAGVATVARTEIEHLMATDANRLLSQIGIEPSPTESGSSGLRITQVAPGSIFDKLGFQQGDIIEEINGAKIQNPQLVTTIFDGMKLLPPGLLSLENISLDAAGLISKLNIRAEGIANEVTKLHRKITSGGDIPISINRHGRPQIRIFRIR